MTPRRRADDENDEWRSRELHPIDREEMAHFASKGVNGSALIIGWGNKSLSVTGVATIGFLMFAVLVGSVHYASHRLEMAMAANHAVAVAEHKELRMGQERLGCAVLMTFEERARFREEYQPGAWRRWCPWVAD